MRTRTISLAAAALWLVTETLAANNFSHSDGTFETANWEQKVQSFGVDGSGGGFSSQEDAGGNPGAFREIFVNRFPASANPANVTHLYQFARQAEYDPSTMGPIGAVHISVEARLFEGVSGMVVPALKQGGVQYVAGGLPVNAQAWTAREFIGLVQNSFSEVEAPDSHPDFSASGGPIVFGYAYVISAPTAEGVESSAGVDNWSLLVSPEGVAAFIINAGLNDAWLNLLTAGQGFFVTVFPDLGVIFLAWFTYDTERPDGSLVAHIGEPYHRWVTAFGAYAGDTAVLDVELTSGGVFDSAEPAPIQEPNYGTITIVFHDCTSATLTYDFPALGLMGEIELQRIAIDNVPLCEALLAELQAR